METALVKRRTALRRWLAVGLLAACTGCALRGVGEEAKFDGYVGRPEAALVEGLGRPARTQVLADGSRVLRYPRQRMMPYSGPLRPLDEPAKPAPRRDEPTGSVNPAGLAAATSSRDASDACAIDFQVDAQGTVRSWRAEALDCRLK